MYVETNGAPETGGNISRRNVARGVAWSAPAIAIASAAPAFAASPPKPQLGGLLTFQRQSGTNSCTFVIGGTGASVYPDQGAWVTNAQSTTTATGLTMTVYLPNAWSGATITRPTGSASTWSMLTAVAVGANPPAGLPAGYVAFETTYTGSWTYSSTNQVLLSNDRPFFQLNRTNGACADAITVFVRRRATVDGVVQTVDRSRAF